jgi:hypothetical protein
VIDVGPIGQQHIGKGASRLVASVRLEDDFFPKHHRGCRLFGLMAVGLALLRAVDAAQADAFRVLVVEDFEGVIVTHCLISIIMFSHFIASLSRFARRTPAKAIRRSANSRAAVL